MTINRRTFIGTTGAALLFGGRVDAKSIKKVGVQLYTVRTEIEKDFDGTLAKVAAIGFKEVEFAGYFNHSPQDVRDALKRHGLAAPAAHIDYPSLAADKLPDILDQARTIGHEYLVNPWVDEVIRKEPDSWKRIADTFNRAGEQSKRAGIQFAYHNHHFEFVPVDGTLPYDVLLQSCDPKLVKMELDLCWITVAGKDPLDYVHRYPGRFPLVHVKGFRGQPPAEGGNTPFERAMPNLTDVGGGGDGIDWKRIFAKSNEAGIKHYFVEHDQPKAPFESLTNSYGYLSRLKF
jgi:sugar phosphate isomerase/epimerase